MAQELVFIRLHPSWSEPVGHFDYCYHHYHNYHFTLPLVSFSARIFLSIDRIISEFAVDFSALTVYKVESK